MKIDFNNKVAIVTGASRGIGSKIADDLEVLGAKVYRLCSKKFNFLEKEDMTKLKEWISSFEKIDILVNSAGIVSGEKDLEKKLIDTLKVNLIAPKTIIKECLDVMARNHHGKIVNIGSIAHKVYRPYRDDYSLSKGALVTLTKSLSLTCYKKGVLINSVSPGPVMTKMLTDTLNHDQLLDLKRTTPSGRLTTMKDVSNVVLFLLSDYNTNISGQDIVLDGGLSLTAGF